MEWLISRILRGNHVRKYLTGSCYFTLCHMQLATSLSCCSCLTYNSRLLGLLAVWLTSPT